jgi:hypothetical protein
MHTTTLALLQVTEHMAFTMTERMEHESQVSIEGES